MIYAIQSGEFVKIGFSGSPRKRLGAIQVSSPVKCVLLGVMEGTIGTERRIHETFASCRVQGEWFNLTAELKAWIDANMRPFEPPRRKPQTLSGNSPRLTARLDSEVIDVFTQFCSENDLSMCPRP